MCDFVGLFHLPPLMVLGISRYFLYSLYLSRKNHLCSILSDSHADGSSGVVPRSSPGADSLVYLVDLILPARICENMYTFIFLKSILPMYCTRAGKLCFTINSTLLINEVSARIARQQQLTLTWALCFKDDLFFVPKSTNTFEIFQRVSREKTSKTTLHNLGAHYYCGDY